MLAPRRLPPEYSAWNRQRHAPEGRTICGLGRLTRRSQQELRQKYPRLTGPFGFQPNNSTRLFEYPWAYHAVEIVPGSHAVEIGGSLSGFQFALAKAGVVVTNVDPGEAASGLGWPVDAASIDRLNRAFRTDVRLVSSTLQEAALGSESADIVYSISVIEHIPAAELPSLMEEIRRILRPGGSFVMTVDLFLNLAPFCARAENEFGTNASVKDLVDQSGLEMIIGRPDELLGFPAFDPGAVLARLDALLVGTYPALAQCVVLRKPVTP